MELVGNTGYYSASTSNIWGSMNETGLQTLTFPVTFKSIISANLQAMVENDTNVFIVTNQLSNTSVKYSLVRINNTTFNVNIHYNIIGYWK